MTECVNEPSMMNDIILFGFGVITILGLTIIIGSLCWAIVVGVREKIK